jgi:hypothetical protein
VFDEAGNIGTAIRPLRKVQTERPGGPDTLAKINNRFGARLPLIVAECSDTDEVPKPPLRERKSRYISHLGDASDETILVSLADKVDNARAILRGLRIHGDALWARFSVSNPQDHLSYYRSLLAVYERRRPGCWLVGELRRVLDQIAAPVG